MQCRLSRAPRVVGRLLVVAALAACGSGGVASPEPARRRPRPAPTQPLRAGAELVVGQAFDLEPSANWGVAIDGTEWVIARDTASTSVELFHLDGGQWGNEGVLTLPQGGVEPGRLSLHDGRLLVGVNDTVFSTSEIRAYRRTSGGWVSDSFPALPITYTYDLDQSGSRAALGVDGGEVDVFAFDGSSWALEQTLTGGADFGRWLGLSGDTLAVCDSSLATVHVFDRQAGSWSESSTLSDGLCPAICNDVALEGDTLVVSSCEVRTFTRSGGVWSVDAPQSLTAQPYGVSLRAGRLVLATASGLQVFHRGLGQWVLDQTLDGKSPIGQTAGWVVARRFDSTFVAYAEVGATCTAATECPLGHCVDGFCCNNACDFSCAACDVPGSLGLCTPVEGAPHDGHPACAASACIDDHTLRDQGSCGGSLTACDVGPLVDCSPYACRADACLEVCGDDADCSSGNACVEGACVEDVRSCGDDHTVVLGGGQRVECAPYTCVDGRCLEACDSTTDCSGDRVCDSEGRCVDFTPEGDASGCDCSVAAPPRPTPAWPLFLVVMARLARRSLRSRWWSLRSAPRVGGQRAGRGRRDAR